MYLVTNPIPTIGTQQSPILVSNSNGILQLLPQSNAFNPTFVMQNISQTVPGYIQTPILSSFPAFHQQPIQLLPMSSLSTQSSQVIASTSNQILLPHNSLPIVKPDIKQEVQFDSAERNEVFSKMTDEDGSKSLNNVKPTNELTETSDSLKSINNSKLPKHTNRNQAPILLETKDNTEMKIRDYSTISHNDLFLSKKKCSDEINLEDEVKMIEVKETLNDRTIFSVGTLNENTVSYQNDSGETVKLDILERAILTIPDL